ncbi:hypothetical protein LJB96_02735 [Methanobrevibacter sp. OttesenSCG-928-K11]|nr:hypothetical protein [Methanobrevibacter sp. OttesenSCG-928-K11]MDL2270525.1 hypothetical protein [Methanobrevibacter sp. OttesenSCG-928-I08]
MKNEEETQNTKNNNDLDKWIAINDEAKDLEKSDINKAIMLYELNIKNGTDLPQTFISLYKLYRKQKDFENEIRICDIAINRIGNNEEKYNARWFTDRKLKTICLRDRNFY